MKFSDNTSAKIGPNDWAIIISSEGDMRLAGPEPPDGDYSAAMPLGGVIVCALALAANDPTLTALLYANFDRKYREAEENGSLDKVQEEPNNRPDNVVSLL